MNNLSDNSSFSLPPPPPKNHKKLFFILGGGCLGLLVLGGVAATLFIGLLVTFSADGSSTEEPERAEGLSYSYGQSTTEERIFGIDASGIRTAMNYKLATNGETLYNSADGNCLILVRHGFAPEKSVNTGDDEEATISLLESYGKNIGFENIDDRDFRYVSSASEMVFAPTKYIEGPIELEGESKYASVHARVITGGSGIAVTISTICSTKEQVQATVQQLEGTITFWNTEAKY